MLDPIKKSVIEVEGFHLEMFTTKGREWEDRTVLRVDINLGWVSQSRLGDVIHHPSDGKGSEGGVEEWGHTKSSKSYFKCNHQKSW